MGSFLKLLEGIIEKQAVNKNPDSDLIVFSASESVGLSTYGEFYSVDICPKCNRLLDADKARYESRCCYKCGYSNGSLFDTKVVIVRDRIANGVVVETVVHSE